MARALPTQKRARFAQASASMPDWTSLPNDLVHDMGDRLLASNDIDTYMAFRAVCHEWRFITKDGPPKAKEGDDIDPITHFEPTKWALLDKPDDDEPGDESDEHNDIITLVNVDTGRFLLKRIPLLRRFFFVGATSGGFILLGESVEPHEARVLNPFTGSIAHFKVRIPCEGVRAVALTMKPTLTVFISTEMGKIMWADRSMEAFKHFEITYPNKISCMTSFGGNVYAIDRYGSIYSSAVVAAAGEPRRRCAKDISMEAIFPGVQDPISDRYYLVESAGDLLLVTKPSGFVLDQPVVRRVNMETQTIEPVSSIGSRALFVSRGRCLSIDADKFHPSIKGGCVYFLEPFVTRGYYAMAEKTILHVADNVVQFEWGWALQGCRPFTLTKVFADYCRSVHFSKLYKMMANKWDVELTDSDDSESDESSSSELDDEESSSSELDDEEASCYEPADD